jgi:hypothetical protein
MNKKLILPLAVILLMAMGAFLLASGSGHFPVKVGDKVYVCNCGETCDCGFVSKKPGKCGCGTEGVEVTVTKVGEDTFTATVNGKERTFKTTAKYVCGCGETCDCYTISNKPGKCSCGMDLKPAAH